MALTTSKKFEDLDFYGDIQRAVTVNAVGVSKLSKHGRFLEEDRDIDENYKIVLRGVLNKQGLKSDDKGKGEDNNGEGNVLEESRPQLLQSSIRQRQRGNNSKHDILGESRPLLLESSIRQRGDNGKYILEESRPRRLESSIRQIGNKGKHSVLEESRPQRLESRSKRKERDEMVYYNAEESPDYKRFLTHSKKFNSKEEYPAFEPLLQDRKVDSKYGVLKYKPVIDIDEESNQEPRRTTNRATTQKIGSSSLKSHAAKLNYCNCGHMGKASTNEKASGMNSDNREKGSESEAIARPQVEFFVKKTNDAIQLRRPMGRGGSRNETMMAVKNSPNNMAPVLENHHLLQDVKLEDDHTVFKRNGSSARKKKNLGVDHNIEKNMRLTRAMSQGVGDSDRKPGGVNQHKHYLSSASVNKVSRLNALKRQDLEKLSSETRPRGRPTNKMSVAENQHMHNPENTKNLTMSIARNKAGMADMAECSGAAQYRKSRNEAGKVGVAECSRAALYRNVKTTKSPMRNQKIGETIVEVDHRNKTTSDMEILDSTALFREGITGPFVPSRKIHYNEKPGSSCACKDTEFRRQLFEILGRPYDKEEYGRLRKTVESGLYFQYHPDLKKKLIKWRYKPGKLLNILRGFLFWLQNLTQEGAFKPWKDGKCLAVEPPRL